MLFIIIRSEKGKTSLSHSQESLLARIETLFYVLFETEVPLCGFDIVDVIQPCNVRRDAVKIKFHTLVHARIRARTRLEN